MTAEVIYVAYRTPSIDLSWIPATVAVRIVVNGGERPSITPPREVTWLEPDGNLGFGAGVNLAAAESQADRLIIVNPDCRLTADHWTPLAQGGAAELVTVPLESGSMPTTVASTYPTPATLVAGALRLRARLRTRLGARSGTTPSVGLARGTSAPLRTHWVSGACLSIDRGRFLEIGGFSRDFFLYFEDVDLSARLAHRYPEMQAVVADVDPGQHAVAASADASGGLAAIERARSAATFASTRAGAAWGAARAVTRWNARWVARRSGPATRASGADIVIVSLGRDTSRGERRRARSWIDIAAVDHQTAIEVRLLDVARWPGPLDAIRTCIDVARGRAVPEALAWSTARARAELARLQPHTIIVLTSRAYDPRLGLGGARVVLDHIDRLSDSYRDRADAPKGTAAGRLAWRLLAAAQLRFERHRPDADLQIAAGLGDAGLLGVQYVPIVSTIASAEPPSSPAHDVAFVGNLRYPPNLEAVRELAEIWPEVLRRRPGTTLLLAGADPDPDAVALARSHGWTLLANFADEREVYAATRIAVAPLPHASGIQTKVIDALRHAVPVVAYGPAAAGFDPSAPLLVVEGRPGLISSVVALLDDDAARVSLGRASAAWVGTHLAPELWTWTLGPRSAPARPLTHPGGDR